MTDKPKSDSTAPRPDLHELVRKHGGSFSAIGLAAWREYDADVERWKADVRAGKSYERNAK